MNGQVCWREGLILQRGGNIGIGITTPEHKLSVVGTIKAKELRDCLNSGFWAARSSFHSIATRFIGP